MSGPAQSFENHAKLVTGYHRVATPLLMFPAFYFLYLFVREFFSLERLAVAMFAFGVIIIAFYARLFPLGVQDRVIRLEERLRMHEILPEDLRPRISEFTASQLVGLRFASDEELPELARRVLDEGIQDRKEIKKAIKNWRPDHQRI